MVVKWPYSLVESYKPWFKNKLLNVFFVLFLKGILCIQFELFGLTLKKGTARILQIMSRAKFIYIYEKSVDSFNFLKHWWLYSAIQGSMWSITNICQQGA